MQFSTGRTYCDIFSRDENFGYDDLSGGGERLIKRNKTCSFCEMRMAIAKLRP